MAFLRGGVFWGWPSSHTTIAFAMAVTILMLFPKQKWVGYMAITYALYIGLGVSTTTRDPAGDRTGCRRGRSTVGAPPPNPQGDRT